MLNTTSVTRAFDGVKAVDDLTLSVAPEIVVCWGRTAKHDHQSVLGLLRRYRAIKVGDIQ